MGKARKHAPERLVNILRQIEAAVVNGKIHPMANRGRGYWGGRERATALLIVARDTSASTHPGNSTRFPSVPWIGAGSLGNVS